MATKEKTAGITSTNARIISASKNVRENAGGFSWDNLKSMYAAGHNQLILRDLNGRTNNESFTVCSKDDIVDYIAAPAQYESELRAAVRYMYGASCHFRRLIQYFVGLTDLAYIVSPTHIDVDKVNPKTIRSNYKKVVKLLESMKIKEQIPKILTVCLREDVYYGTMWVADCNVIFQQLPSEYCRISTIEDNVFNVSFNFSYFDANSEMLEYYPKEFNTKYNQYLKDRQNRWIELDSPTTFAIKVNTDIPEYAMPPFAGLLRELYDLEDYKQLKLTKASLENYSLLNMQLPMDADGNFLLDFDRARTFWYNLDEVLPEEVGSILSPMKIEQLKFEKSNAGDTTSIADAEEALFTAAGVSSLLFNNPSASANALLLSIKVDQEITFGIVKSIQGMINRFIHHESYATKYECTFLNCSPFNRQELGDQYLKAAQYGLPTVMLYAASQGLGQIDVDTMAYLENEVLDLKSKLVPLQSSNTQSGGSESSTSDEGGRPTKDVGDLTDSGEQSQEDGDDW